MSVDINVCWVTERGRSGARHQANVISEHMDVTQIRAQPIGVPADTSWESAIKEGEEMDYAVDELADAIREIHPDVTMFHVFSQNTIQAAPEVSTFCPTVLRAGLNPMELALTLQGTNHQTITWYSGFDHVVCASHATRRKLRASGVSDDRTTVIPTAVDMSGESVTAPRRDVPHTLGYLGRLAPAKNPELPVYALYALREIEPTLAARLKYAGAINEQVADAVTGLASKLGLGINNVTFSGYVEDVPGWFADIGVNVHPSFTENFPQSVLEAAQQGVPTVAAEAAWTDEFDSLVTCPADDPWAWGETLAEILTNEAYRYELARAQQEEAEEKYAIQDVGEQYRSLFEDLVDELGEWKVPPSVRAEANL